MYDFLSAAESVFARCLSAIKDDRVAASKVLVGPQNTKFTGDKTQFIEDIRQVRFIVSWLSRENCVSNFCIHVFQKLSKYIS